MLIELSVQHPCGLRFLTDTEPKPKVQLIRLSAQKLTSFSRS